MCDGINQTIQAGYRHILIEGDNNTVIQAVQGSGRVPWCIQQLIKDIQY